MKIIDNRKDRTDDILVRGSVVKITRSGEWMAILLDSGYYLNFDGNDCALIEKDIEDRLTERVKKEVLTRMKKEK